MSERRGVNMRRRVREVWARLKWYVGSALFCLGLVQEVCLWYENNRPYECKIRR